MRRLFARLLLGLAAVILIAVSALHMTGLPMAQEFARGDGEPRFLRQVIEILWVLPSWHWVAFALAAAWSCLRLPETLDHRAMLIIIGVALLVDGALVYVALGGFVGAFAAMGAGAAVSLGALISSPRPSALSAE